MGFLPETDDTEHLEVYREALASGISGETAAGNRLLRILFMRPHRVPELSHDLLQAVALEAGFALLMGLMVLPEYRRRGIGTQLVLAVAECARSQGRTRLILRVGEANAPARALYEGLSFRRGATRAHYYSDGENAVEMALSLTRSP